MAKLQIGSFPFPSKKAARDRIRKILWGSDWNKPLTGEDDALMRALLERHPYYDEKRGAGIAEFYISEKPPDTPGQPTNPCFYLRRTDGSATDFSYLQCLNPPDHRSDVLCAMRYAIQPQVELIERDSGEHAHHVIPFLALAEAFIVAADLEWKDIGLIRGRDGCGSDQFADPALARRWSSFHGQLAVLKVEPGSEHLARKRGDWKAKLLRDAKPG